MATVFYCALQIAPKFEDTDNDGTKSHHALVEVAVPGDQPRGCDYLLKIGSF